MTATTELTTSTGGVPEAVSRRGISESEWRTLCLSLFPGAHPNSVLMVIDYCKARKLDPLKKPCHIVPMEVKRAGTNTYEWRDVVMPGIYEHRTTAQRTGQYLGHSKPEYGPEIEVGGVKAPEWCELTIYRWNTEAETRVEFPVRTYFREVVATKRGGEPNARWAKAPIQMLTKCCEAAGLREAFPDEIGGEPTAEEMDGQRAPDAAVIDVKPGLVKPEGFDEWLTDLIAACDSGDDVAQAWADSPEANRTYLAETDATTYDQVKAKASQ